MLLERASLKTWMLSSGGYDSRIIWEFPSLSFFSLQISKTGTCCQWKCGQAINSYIEGHSISWKIVPYRISIWNSWKAILNQLTLETVDNPYSSRYTIRNNKKEALIYMYLNAKVEGSYQLVHAPFWYKKVLLPPFNKWHSIQKGRCNKPRCTCWTNNTYNIWTLFQNPIWVTFWIAETVTMELKAQCNCTNNIDEIWTVRLINECK